MPELVSRQLLVEVVGLPGHEQLVVHQLAAVHLKDGELGARERVVLGRGPAERLPFDGVEAPGSLARLGALLGKPRQRTELRPRRAAGVSSPGEGSLSATPCAPARGQESVMTDRSKVSSVPKALVACLRALNRAGDAATVRELADDAGASIAAMKQRLLRARAHGWASSAGDPRGPQPLTWFLTAAGEEVLRCES